MPPPDPSGHPEDASDHPWPGAFAKSDARAWVRSLRAGVSEAERSVRDQGRTDLLVAALRTLRPTRVAVYLSMPGEPRTDELVAYLSGSGVEVVAPVVSSYGSTHTPDWAVMNGHERVGRRGFREPAGPRLGASGISDVDVVLVPGLAGTVMGGRLGTGGGWYDRALSYAPHSQRWLLLDEAEIVPALPLDSWDLPVNVLFTPSRRVDARPDGNDPVTTQR